MRVSRGQNVIVWNSLKAEHPYPAFDIWKGQAHAFSVIFDDAAVKFIEQNRLCIDLSVAQTIDGNRNRTDLSPWRMEYAHLNEGEVPYWLLFSEGDRVFGLPADQVRIVVETGRLALVDTGRWVHGFKFLWGSFGPHALRKGLDLCYQDVSPDELKKYQKTEIYPGVTAFCPDEASIPHIVSAVKEVCGHQFELAQERGQPILPLEIMVAPSGYHWTAMPQASNERGRTFSDGFRRTGGSAAATYTRGMRTQIFACAQALKAERGTPQRTLRHELYHYIHGRLLDTRTRSELSRLWRLARRSGGSFQRSYGLWAGEFFVTLAEAFEMKTVGPLWLLKRYPWVYELLREITSRNPVQSQRSLDLGPASAPLRH